jgi:hypothetical protein
MTRGVRSPINPDIPVKERNRVRRKTTYAVRTGKLVRKPCEVCGAEKVEAHHRDYRDHLNVKWLCRKHHRAEHKRIADAAGFGIGRETELRHAAWRAVRAATLEKQFREHFGKGETRPGVDPEVVARMAAAGMTQKAIGAEFGMSAFQMHNFMWSHGIPSSRSKPAEYWSGTPRFLLKPDAA